MTNEQMIRMLENEFCRLTEKMEEHYTYGCDNTKEYDEAVAVRRELLFIANQMGFYLTDKYPERYGWRCRGFYKEVRK